MISKDKQKEQTQKFVKIAHALGCDESDAAFNDQLKKLAGTKPSEPKKQKGKPK